MQKLIKNEIFLLKNAKPSISKNFPGNLSNPDWEKEKRLLIQEKVLSPQIILSKDISSNFDEFSKNHRLEFSGLTKALPPEVQILTLEPWKDNTYLLRLEHLLEKGDNVDVDLRTLFAVFDVVSARETSLGIYFSPEPGFLVN